MARSKGDGERLPLKKIHKYQVRNSDDDWSEVEGSSGIALIPETREKIHLVTTAYANFGPLYSPRRSILSKDAGVAIESWLSATKRLIKTLTPSGTDLGEFMPRKKPLSQMSKLSSITVLAIFLVSEIVISKTQPFSQRLAAGYLITLIIFLVAKDVYSWRERTSLILDPDLFVIVTSLGSFLAVLVGLVSNFHKIIDGVKKASQLID